MKKTSIDRAITFIEHWTGKNLWHSSEIQLSPAVPSALHKLDESLGGFWGSSSFPFEAGETDHNTKRGLFNIQDEIVDPRTANTETDVVSLIHENQGVWNFGYNKKYELMINGDWAVDGRHINYSDWTSFPAEIEDALVCTLLSNFFFYMMSENNFTQVGIENSQLEECPVLLWSHPAWGSFKGFSTDSDDKKLMYDGFGVIDRP